MKTRVYVHLNSNSFVYVFDSPLDCFLRKWNEQIESIGYYSGFDERGKVVVINPSNCGSVMISNQYLKSSELN